MKEQPMVLSLGQPRVTEHTSGTLPSLEEADVAVPGPRDGWMMFNPHTTFSVSLHRSGLFLRDPFPNGPEPFSMACLGLSHLIGGLTIQGALWLWLTLFLKQGGMVRSGICFPPLLTQQLRHLVVPPR